MSSCVTPELEASAEMDNEPPRPPQPPWLPQPPLEPVPQPPRPFRREPVGEGNTSPEIFVPSLP